MAPLPILRLALQNTFSRQSLRSAASPITLRPFSQIPLSRFPRKESQDREEINTEVTEYSKSASDDAAAHQSEAAFDPDAARPEEEKEIAGKGNEDENPLEVSPANPEVSKQQGQTKGGAENSGKDRQSSSSGSPRKNGT